jgi:transcriptional regulator with XRE-family HTH domain
MDLAAAIRYRRNALGYSQEQLADAIGIDRQRVVALEKPGYLPTVRTLLRVADALGVSAWRLLKDAERLAK